MKRLDFSRDRTAPIETFESVGTSAVRLGTGEGETRVYCLRFDPGGRIGRHPTARAQLFLVVEGAGWVSGGDGRVEPLSAGQGAWFARGEMHAKGSDSGMTAIMVQVTDLEPPEA